MTPEARDRLALLWLVPVIVILGAALAGLIA